MQFYFTVQNVPDVTRDKNVIMKHYDLHALDYLRVQHYLMSFYKTEESWFLEERDPHASDEFKRL